MKKLFCVLAVLLVLASAAFAEETTTSSINITFRNDIAFGMSMQDVVNTESETLTERTFENGNPHVTFLSTDDFAFADNITGTIQYLFWDDALFAVLYTMDDGSTYADYVQSNIDSYGEPEAMSAQGTADWVERMTGNTVELDGEQYVWSWDNNISLTMLPFGDGYIVLWIDAN